MKRIQIQQRKGESPDFVAMRAYASVVSTLDDRALEAMAAWIWRHASDTLRARRRMPPPEAKSSGVPLREVYKLPAAHPHGQDCSG